MSHPPFDSTLVSWGEIEGDPWPALLIGNGASRAVWDRFSYASLLAVARDPDHGGFLADREQALFQALDTQNFEVVLQSLGTTALVNRVLGVTDKITAMSYESVQRALIEAVRWVHPPRGQVPRHTLEAVRTSLSQYKCVYSTNYDLIVYWAVMVDPHGAGFVDCCWGPGGTFDPENADVWYDDTRILYLHGGIHLEGDLVGRSRKRIPGEGTNLLDTFETYGIEDGWLPLFVSEGTSREKEIAIARSSYLSFANDEFARDDHPLVVFGHSLGQQDEHLARAIRSHPRRLAISIVPGEDAHVIAAKGRYRGMFPAHPLDFFDSRTHPLGSSDLRVPIIGEQT